MQTKTDCNAGNNENYIGNLDNGDDDAFQQVFKAKFACQVKPIAPSGAGLQGRQANANHPSQDSDDVDNDFTMVSVKQIYKVNRCLARYSPRATTTNRPTNRAPKKPAWPGPN